MFNFVRRITHSKIAVLVAFILIGSGILVVRSANVRASHTVFCENSFGQLANGHAQTGSAFSTWDDANFHYQVFVFGTFANDAGRKGDRIDSVHCNNPASPADPELVSIDNPTNDLRWQTPSGVRIRPIEARLGVPRMPGSNDGAWMNRPPSGVAPTDRPPVYQFAQYRAAGLMDDAGMAIINGQKVWCIGMATSPALSSPAERANCQDALSFNPAHGAGYTFVEDNCVSGNDTDGTPLNCADGNNFNWYRFWYPSYDYTSLIGLRGDGTLNDFRLHMEGIQLVDGTGFGTYMFMTFKYPKPTVNAACAGISVPGSVLVGSSFGATVGMRNTGGIMWSFNNYWLNENASPAWGVSRVDLPPPGLVNPGETVTFNFSANAPGSPGTYPFNWQMTNAGGGFGEVCTATIKVEAPFIYQPEMVGLGGTLVTVGGPPINLNWYARNISGYTGPAGTLYAYSYTISPAGAYTPAPGSNASLVKAPLAIGPLGPGAVVGDSASVPVPALPDGSRICFYARVNPGQGNNVDPPSVPDYYSRNDVAIPPYEAPINQPNDRCYEIENPRYPYLTTTKGDIHAGGGMGFAVNCPNPAGSSPSITGRTNGAVGSVSEYVLSVGQTLPDSSYIGSFGSKLNPAPGSELTFGNQPGRGKYGTICRPPLATAAEAYQPELEISGASFAISSLVLNTAVKMTPTSIGPSGNPAITLVGGPTLLRGTLYVRGDVYISSNVLPPPLPAYSRNNLPTFGLIATGNIYIQPNVTSLYGFYFAGGQIDTCRNNFANTPDITAPGQASVCGNLLTVRGLMMAESFKFRRTGNPAASSGLDKSEEVNFGGEVFLAPPPAFNDFISPRATRQNYQGERPPLR